jgi:hypothetical protein
MDRIEVIMADLMAGQWNQVARSSGFTTVSSAENRTPV